LAVSSYLGGKNDGASLTRRSITRDMAAWTLCDRKKPRDQKGTVLLWHRAAPAPLGRKGSGPSVPMHQKARPRICRGRGRTNIRLFRRAKNKEWALAPEVRILWAVRALLTSIGGKVRARG